MRCAATMVAWMLVGCAVTNTPPDAPPVDARACIQGESCDCRASLVLPAGVHWVGADQPDGFYDPAHRVTLTRSIWVGTYEASAGCYRRCVAEGSCTEPYSGGTFTGAWPGLSDGYWRDPSARDLPIIGVDPAQADAYCEWLGGRLPTNAEWEKLARGEDGRDLPWLPAPADPRFPVPTPVVDACGNATGPGLPPSGCGRALPAPIDMPMGRGPYGHFHVIGNAREYVQDGFAPYSADDVVDPFQPPGEGNRLVRSLFAPAYARDDRGIVGVRCAFDSEPEMLAR